MTASSYSGDRTIACVGQTSSHLPQNTQRPKQISQVRLPAATSVVIDSAFAGQAIVQAPQAMQRSGS
jgi:hypothetical protein